LAIVWARKLSIAQWHDKSESAMRLVAVGPAKHRVDLERLGPRQWVAVGDFCGDTIRKKGISRNAAVAAWRRAAELRASQAELALAS
jgi:hypothetical protein